jgi:hypothetical protein
MNAGTPRDPDSCFHEIPYQVQHNQAALTLLLRRPVPQHVPPPDLNKNAGNRGLFAE